MVPVETTSLTMNWTVQLIEMVFTEMMILAFQTSIVPAAMTFNWSIMFIEFLWFGNLTGKLLM